MEFTNLPITVAAFFTALGCCCIGVFIKECTLCKFIDNQNIPPIMGICGAILYVILSNASAQNIILGAFFGLSSTGFYETFRNCIKNPKFFKKIFAKWIGDFQDEADENDNSKNNENKGE